MRIDIIVECTYGEPRAKIIMTKQLQQASQTNSKFLKVLQIAQD